MKKYIKRVWHSLFFSSVAVLLTLAEVWTGRNDEEPWHGGFLK